MGGESRVKKDGGQSLFVDGYFRRHLSASFMAKDRTTLFSGFERRSGKRLGTQSSTIFHNPESRANQSPLDTRLQCTKFRQPGWKNLGTPGARLNLRCFGCDNRHLLYDCFAASETVSEAREQRKNSNRCFNCGSRSHWMRDCKWSDLRFVKRRLG
jgi:hypothetical protein